MTVEKEPPPTTLKQKALRETKKYLGCTVYLAVVFGIFNNYRRLVLSEYEIPYLNYGYSVIEALILAKVILIGEAFKLGERHSDQPLIVPTLYKSFVFGLLVVAFTVLEKLVTGAIRHEDLAQIALDAVSKGRNEILARILMMFVAFVPFFAFIELQRALGTDSYIDLFFRRRLVPAAEAAPSSDQRGNDT